MLILILATGTLFAKDSKHQKGDILLGFDLGLGFTTNLGKIRDDSIPNGNYAMAFDLGMNVDYYPSKWLSFSSGFLVRGGLYLFWDDKVPLVVGTRNVSDFAKTPVSFAIPIMAHINMPVLNFLYFGAGIMFNIPFKSMLDSNVPGYLDTKGKPFVGIPLDFGFDFIRAGRGGGRLFARLMPELHKNGKPVLFGLVWQPYNIKIK